jgi:hypothetical protein
MKQLVICMMVLLLGANTAMTQGIKDDMDGPLRQRVEAQRVAFLTQKLDLSPEESAAFWPIYNEFRDEQHKLRKDARPAKMPRNMTDDEAEAFIEAQLDQESAVIALKRKYFARLQEVVGPQKVAQLGQAEMAFNREVINTLRERMGRGNRNGPLRK